MSDSRRSRPLPRAASSLGLGLLAAFPAACPAQEGPQPPQTDFETRLGSCKVPVPQAFTCRSMPEWGPFLSALQENAAAGFPPDMDLFTNSRTLLERFQEKPYPPQDFFKYLCGGSDATWPLPDRFCLFGFVGALFIQSRHLLYAQEPEVRKAVDMDLQYATTVLGKEGSVDFLDSSPWPVTILDVYLNINQTEFMSYEQYALTNPIRPPAVPLESIHWQPPTAAELQLQGRRALPPSALVAVLGTHATLSLEPVDVLRRFVHNVQIRPVFYGLEPRWCQILGMCDQGTTALSQLFKAAEHDPYGYPWSQMVDAIQGIYDADDNLRQAELLLCTEPLAGCLMLRQVAARRNRRLPLLGYLGVALLNSCPPQDLNVFWRALRETMAPPRQASNSNAAPAVVAVNNLILSEQIVYQSGLRAPYVRAHGLYTGMSYVPLKANEVLVWRAPLFVYQTSQCSIYRFLEGMPSYPINFRFVEESESIDYREVSKHKAVVLLPWDHALMTFYELYSAGMPLLLPAAEWMYRFLYQRGQLSVGERMYQSIMPGHKPPHVEFAEAESFKERPGPPNPATGMGSAKAARNVAEDMLTRGLDAEDLGTAKQYLKAALELMQDMKFFLTVAENRTHEDSYTSMGVVRRSGASQHADPDVDADAEVESGPAASDDASTLVSASAAPWHPYTPFQMSPVDSNDWTRMRKGGWWLRRGVRFDAMRYWYQFSDFARFPGINYFANLPDLLCMAQSFDTRAATEKMRRYNEETLVHSASFWVHSFVQLLGTPAA